MQTTTRSHALLVYVPEDMKLQLRELSRKTGAPVTFHVRKFIATALEVIAQER